MIGEPVVMCEVTSDRKAFRGRRWQRKSGIKEVGRTTEPRHQAKRTAKEKKAFSFATRAKEKAF